MVCSITGFHFNLSAGIAMCDMAQKAIRALASLVGRKAFESNGLLVTQESSIIQTG